MIPVYVYVPVVLVLLTLHGYTAWSMAGRIRRSRAGLEAKDILLEGPLDRNAIMGHWPFSNPRGADVSAGGVLVLTFAGPVKRVRIRSTRWTELKVEAEPA